MTVFSAPFVVCLEITSLCNLNCKHCLASTTQSNQDLTTDEILNIIDQIKELKVFRVAIFGREPLMRKDFFTILDALDRLKIDIFINTNGTLVTKDMAKRLSRYPIKTYVVSLDGSCAEVQDPCRGEGSFSKSIEGIQNLIAEKCHVLISTTVTRFNYRDLENIVLFCKRLGVDRVALNELLYMGNAACYYEDLSIPLKERMELLYSLEDLEVKFKEFITGPVFKISKTMKEINNNHNMNERFPLKINPCPAALTKCAIRPDGWVTPCELLWDVKAGNLKEQSLYDIWHNSPVMKVFRETVEIHEDEIPECKDCNYLRLCYKGHRCRPYYYPGRFEHKEFYCWRNDIINKCKKA